MLKKCYGLFLGLVVLAGSACVTPTHASSASIIIVSIRAGTQASASEERVVVYNNSSVEADITNWCLTNKSLMAFACFKPESSNEKIYLPAYSYATLTSISAANNDQAGSSVVYEPNNNSGGSIVASADSISLINADNQIIDQYSWTSSVPSTHFWLRTKLSVLPDVYIDTDNTIDWQKMTSGEILLDQIEYREVLPEIPPEEPNEEESAEPPINSNLELPLIITEVLPNALGSDTGNEYIEIFNPNELVSVSLSGYKLAVGPSLEKIINLNNYILKPGEYKLLTNAEYGYSLLNTSSRVALFSSLGILVSAVPSYNSPAEGRAWALIDGVWQYTNQPTPGEVNVVGISSIDDEVEPKISLGSTLKPCAANQYRSLETNRCRNVSVAAAAPIACKEGQERNPETNRCRTIANTSGAVDCKEGQERNPETNRCRNIKKLVTADFGVKGAKNEKQAGMSWYMWAAIAGIVLIIAGYTVWEWRVELKKIFMAIKAKFAAKAN